MALCTPALHFVSSQQWAEVVMKVRVGMDLVSGSNYIARNDSDESSWGEST